jgi:hypothetical protein
MLVSYLRLMLYWVSNLKAENFFILKNVKFYVFGPKKYLLTYLSKIFSAFL